MCTLARGFQALSENAMIFHQGCLHHHDDIVCEPGVRISEQNAQLTKKKRKPSALLGTEYSTEIGIAQRMPLFEKPTCNLTCKTNKDTISGSTPLLNN